MKKDKIGPRINQYLKEFGIVQYKLAERVGIGKSTFSQKMEGYTRLYAWELEAICKELGVSPERFIKW